jgi:hypothetical protein
MDYFDKVATPVVVDYSSIQSSSGSFFTVSSGMGRPIRKVKVYDTTGVELDFFVNGELEFITGPGEAGEITVTIPSGSTLSIRSHGAAPVSGSVVINMLG